MAPHVGLLPLGCLRNRMEIVDGRGTAFSTAPQETEVSIVWTERGGPPVATPSGQGGYGSKLINRGMSVQLGGMISCDWLEEGVVVTLQMPKDRLTM